MIDIAGFHRPNKASVETSELEELSFGEKPPVQVEIGPQLGYLVSVPEHFLTILKASRNLTPKLGIATTKENMFGTPPGAISVYKADDSGIALSPAPASRVGSKKKPNILSSASSCP